MSVSVTDEMTLVGYFLKDVRTIMLGRKVERILSQAAWAAVNIRGRAATSAGAELSAMQFDV